MLTAITYNICLNRNGYVNRQGLRQVVIELYQPGRRCSLNTRLHVLPQDFHLGRIQPSDPNHDLLNRQLRRIVRRLMELEDEMLDNRQEPTPQLIVEAYRHNLTRSATISEWVESVIQPSGRRSLTKRNYLTLTNSLQLFHPNLCIRDITHDIIERWQNWMRDERHLTANTIALRLKTLRCLVNEALKRNVLRHDEDPFRHIHIPEIKARHEHLTDAELALLANAPLPTRRLRHIRDAFLFCCYTGLRWSDFRHLTTANLTNVHAQPTLTLRQQKTGRPLTIPLAALFHGAPLAILARYPTIERLAAIGDNTHCNKDLRLVAQAAGITKHLHWHLARHTCGTLLNQHGLRMQEIQFILGHQRQSTTERHYAETLLPQVLHSLHTAFPPDSQ